MPIQRRWGARILKIMNAAQIFAATMLTFGLMSSAARAETSGVGAAALRRSAASADVFSQNADGAIERTPLPETAPIVSVAAGAHTGLIPSPAERRDFAVQPPAVFVPRVASRTASPLPRSALAAAALEGGLVLALVAAGLWRTLPATDEILARTAETIDPVVSTLAMRGARAVSAPAAVPVPPVAPASISRGAEPFIDARMPVGTWRAISQREQALIESWDQSREKALGRASLEQWLDAHPVAGVDTAALKLKLARA